MRASSAMKLLSACCGGFLMSMPPALVDAKKAILDLRPPGDQGTEKKNCANAAANNYRYIQVEVFDYNDQPWVVFNYRQVADECGNPLPDGAARLDETMEYNAAVDGDVTGRLQMDMYVCAPFGYYELEVTVKSTNGNKPMEKVAWEIEYGADEYHIWDTLNSPFYGYNGDFTQFSANGDSQADRPYAPIPPKYDGGDGVTYKWPFPDAKGYYSHMYTGPFPPLMCDNLLPTGVQYEGCYAEQSGWTQMTGGPAASDSNNAADIAEKFRMYDGILINDSDPNEAEDLKIDRVMSPARCAELCSGHNFFGLSTATKCACGNAVAGSDQEDCGLVDSDYIPEYEYLCSGDSRFLCGTDTLYSIYSLDGTGPTPTPPTPTPPTPAPTPGDYEYEELGCVKDSRNNRVMTLKYAADTMSAEICVDYCVGQDAGYAYFGTQYSNECWCSVSIATGLDFNHNRCVMDCAKNAGEKCGGYNAISAYKIGEAVPADDDATPAPVDNPTPSEVSYDEVGCFQDNKGSPKVRIMGSNTESDNMTPELCADRCNDGSNTHFGNQYGRECWCADDSDETSIRQHGTSTNCKYECSGDADEDCGGWNAMSVYKYT